MARTTKKAHKWTEEEQEDLLRAAMFDRDLWGYCPTCGEEVEVYELDNPWAYCGDCDHKVRVDLGPLTGLV